MNESVRLAKSQDGQTGLILASQNGHEGVVRLLLEHDVKAADKVPGEGGVEMYACMHLLRANAFDIGAIIWCARIFY